MTAKRAIRASGWYGGNPRLGTLRFRRCAFPPWLNNRGPNAVYDVQRPTYGPDTGKPFFRGWLCGCGLWPAVPACRMQLESEGQPVHDRPSVSVESGAWTPE